MSGKVLVTVPLPAPFEQMLSEADVEIIGRIPSTDELCDRLRTGEYSVLCPQLQDPVSAEVLDAGAGSLRAVCNYAVGYNNVDVAAATERGIAVTNTPGVLTAATADLAIALMLAVSRRIVEGDEFVRAGKFEGWGPGVMLGVDLNHAQLGIIGFGRIGQAVARRALAFGMRVVYAARDSVVVDADLCEAVAPMAFDELLATSDVISLHMPLTEGTRHLIDAAAIAAMKANAILINTARGPIVNEMALVSAGRMAVFSVPASMCSKKNLL